MVSLWSRNNVVWLRRRWAYRRDEPGRAARADASSGNGTGGEGGPGRGRRSDADLIRGEFLAGAVVVDCPRAGCSGMLLTGAREIERPGGTGARLTFRCTRSREHEFAVTMDPYTADEVERLKATLYRGERLTCVRCGTPLELGSQASQNGWGKSLEPQPAFHCSWCGVKWVAPTELTRRAG